jgi:hypothetical protein
MSDYISQAANRADHKMSPSDADALRTRYLEIMNLCTPDECRPVFEQIAKNIYEASQAVSPPPPPIEGEDASDYFLVASLGDRAAIIPVSAKDSSAFMLIGRYECCDLMLHNVGGGGVMSSRVHAIVFVLPGMVPIIVDPGSCVGVTCESRSAPGKPLEESLPGARKVLKFEQREDFTLRLCVETVKFHWAKPCVVCMTAPRSVEAMPCQHMCMCRGCAAKVDACPICRAPVVRFDPARNACESNARNVPVS